MDAQTLELLELSDVLELVARRARSEAARSRIRRRRPTASPEWINRQRRLLEEVADFDEGGGARPDLSDLDEPVAVIELLASDRAFLDGPQLVCLLQISRALEAARSGFESDSELGRLASAVSFDPGLASELERCLDAEGAIRDDADPRLGPLRKKQAGLRKRIRKTLESALSGPESRYLIDEPYITERAGRSVLPVKRGTQSGIAGIVHGSSGSGATVFVEPMRVVELNNDLQLLSEEQAELERAILRDLTGLALQQQPELGAAAETLGELDTLFAVHEFGRDFDAAPADLVADEGLLIEDARHPLLVESLGAERTVPISIRLEPQQRVLVISGPNTGGKTVALKTVGLLCLLAHCGLPVPAARSRLPRLEGIWADIGDHQSIAEHLSTFSAHVHRLIEIEADARPPCLVLLDEAGRGTDPASGSALAAAMMEHLLERGALVVATTHHAELKYLAASRPGMVNAGVQLDSETMAPTYGVEMGVAATSSGLEIARQLGVPEPVLEAAAAFRSDDEDRVEEFLEELRRRQDQVASERDALQQEQRRLERQRGEEAELARRHKEQLEQRFERRLQELALEFRKRSEAWLDGVDDEQEARRRRREARAREALLKEAFRRKMKAGAAPAEEAGGDSEIRAGDRVRHPLWRTGRVLRVEDGEAVVEVAGKRVMAPVGELETLREEPEKRRLPRNVTLQASEAPDRELNLVGQRVEEAVARADKFLDQAVVSRLDEVRLIHGFGTGRLQRALEEFLRDHTHVASYRLDGGATTVRLKI